LKHDYSVSSLEVFGSFVRGDQTPASDVDLLVDFDESPSLFRFIQLEDELTAILHVKVDLVMKAGLKPTLGAMILGEALPV
jgi:predicted nucleotidyltransferase